MDQVPARYAAWHNVYWVITTGTLSTDRGGQRDADTKLFSSPIQIDPYACHPGLNDGGYSSVQTRTCKTWPAGIIAGDGRFNFSGSSRSERWVCQPWLLYC